MSEKDDGGQAFPQANPLVSLDPETGKLCRIGDGMSLRDWFAGQAVLATAGYRETADIPDIARQAYQIADALLAERRKRESGS